MNTELQKRYYIQNNVGKVKYAVSYHNGVEKHLDGSPFFGVRCISNKKALVEFEKQLISEGYVYGDCYSIKKKEVPVIESKYTINI